MKKQTTPRTWRACAECGRRLPNRAHHRQCAGCRKRAQGRPLTQFNRAIGRYVEVQQRP